MRHLNGIGRKSVKIRNRKIFFSSKLDGMLVFLCDESNATLIVKTLNLWVFVKFNRGRAPISGQEVNHGFVNMYLIIGNQRLFQYQVESWQWLKFVHWIMNWRTKVFLACTSNLFWFQLPNWLPLSIGIRAMSHQSKRRGRKAKADWYHNCVLSVDKRLKFNQKMPKIRFSSAFQKNLRASFDTRFSSLKSVRNSGL